MVHGQDLKVNNKTINWTHLKRKKQQEENTIQLWLLGITYNFSNWFPGKHSVHCFLKLYKTQTTKYLLLSHSATPGLAFVITEFGLHLQTCTGIFLFPNNMEDIYKTRPENWSNASSRCHSKSPLSSEGKHAAFFFFYKWGNSRHEKIDTFPGVWVHSPPKYLLQNTVSSFYIHDNVGVKIFLPLFIYVQQ